MYELSTMILFVGITYSMRDLLSGLNNYAWPANGSYCIYLFSMNIVHMYTIIKWRKIKYIHYCKH